MSKTTRRIIYILFVLFFLASVPLVLSYTAGYRYNFNKNRLERTGVLFVDSTPEGADIFINNHATGKKTPARIAALLPRDYQIRVEKTGYLSWQKTLPIFSAETTFANSIILPKDAAPQELTRIDATRLDLSPSGEFMIILSANQKSTTLGFYNLKGRAYQLALELSNPLDDVRIAWLGSEKAIVKTQKMAPKFFIVDALNPKNSVELTKKFNEPIKKVIPDPIVRDSLIVQTSVALYRFALTNNKKELLGRDIANDYLIQGGRIYTVRQYLTDFYLISRPLTNALKADEKNVIQIPQADYQFLESPDGFILLRNNDRILLIKLEPVPRIILDDVAYEARWFKIARGWNLIYYTNFEIYTFEAGAEQKKLVTRVGEALMRVRTLASGDHAIFLSGGTIYLIEFDERGERNIWDIAPGMNMSDFAFDTEQGTIYFVGKVVTTQKTIFYKRVLK